MSPTIMMMIAIVLVQVICLELRGPGCLSIGASNAGPCVGTSKDQHQVNTNYEDDEEGQVNGDKEDQQKGDKDESDNFSFQAESDLQGLWGLAEMQMGF